MIGLPEFGQKVRVWPRPGRMVQNGPAPIDRWGGGRWLPKSGAWITWTPAYVEQLQAGDLLLHHPPCDDHQHGPSEPDKDGKIDEKGGECINCGRTPEQAKDYESKRVVRPKPAELAAAKPEWSHAAATQAHFELLEKASQESKDKGGTPALQKATVTAPKPDTSPASSSK